MIMRPAGHHDAGRQIDDGPDQRLLPAGESPPEVTELALEVTYDGGETWQPVATRAEGDSTFTATVQHPRLADTNGSVGMRVTASDDQGNSVIQTAPRVYGLR